METVSDGKTKTKSKIMNRAEQLVISTLNPLIPVRDSIKRKIQTIKTNWEMREQIQIDIAPQLAEMRKIDDLLDGLVGRPAALV